MQYSIPQERAVVLGASQAMRVYGLFACAIGLTAVGVVLGTFASPLLFRGGVYLLLTLVEFGIILTAPLWLEQRPWNAILFGLFPLLSGITVAPYLLLVSSSTEGSTLLLNALLATTFMAASAAVFARTTSLPLALLGRFLVFALLGLLGMSILQLLVPSLRQSLGLEMFLSGAGVLLFAAFTAYDVQRVEALARSGSPPYLLALSLYLDIFNLFLSIVRFMMAISGNRR